jgi:hypothetical protein
MIVKRNGILKQTIDASGLMETAPQHPIVQVRLYTAHSIISGTLRLGYTRLSDHLNFGPPVLELGQAELICIGQETIHRAQQVAYVRKDSVLLAIDRLSTDYAGSNPALREQRQALSITADLGHFIVTGALHLTHGVDLQDWLTEGRFFVPLTDSTIHGGDAKPRREPIAIINRAMLAAILH